MSVGHHVANYRVSHNKRGTSNVAVNTTAATLSVKGRAKHPVIANYIVDHPKAFTGIGVIGFSMVSIDASSSATSLIPRNNVVTEIRARARAAVNPSSASLASRRHIVHDMAVEHLCVYVKEEKAAAPPPELAWAVL